MQKAGLLLGASYQYTLQHSRQCPDEDCIYFWCPKNNTTLVMNADGERLFVGQLVSYEVMLQNWRNGVRS